MDGRKCSKYSIESVYNPVGLSLKKVLSAVIQPIKACSLFSLLFLFFLHVFLATSNLTSHPRSPFTLMKSLLALYANVFAQETVNTINYAESLTGKLGSNGGSSSAEELSQCTGLRSFSIADRYKNQPCVCYASLT